MPWPVGAPFSDEASSRGTDSRVFQQAVDRTVGIGAQEVPSAAIFNVALTFPARHARTSAIRWPGVNSCSKKRAVGLAPLANRESDGAAGPTTVGEPLQAAQQVSLFRLVLL